MTTLSTGTNHAASGNRLLNVVRLQFLNKQTFLWVPVLILGGSWVLSMLIFWIVGGAGQTGVKAGGGAQAPLWYFLAIGIQAMTMTFPFSQAMSLTRREFFLVSLAAAAVSATGMSAVFVLLGLLEQATAGYGFNAYFSYLEWVWVAGPLAAALTYFVLAVLFFVLGFWFATIFKRFGALGLASALLATGLVLVGFVALVTFQQAWPVVAQWFAVTGSLGLTLWGLLLAAVLAAGSYLTLRRMPV